MSFNSNYLIFMHVKKHSLALLIMWTLYLLNTVITICIYTITNTAKYSKKELQTESHLC